jgi:hypothetical protein
MENVIKLPDIYAWKKTRLWKDIISVFFSPWEVWQVLSPGTQQKNSWHSLHWKLNKTKAHTREPLSSVCCARVMMVSFVKSIYTALPSIIKRYFFRSSGFYVSLFQMMNRLNWIYHSSRNRRHRSDLTSEPVHIYIYIRNVSIWTPQELGMFNGAEPVTFRAYIGEQLSICRSCNRSP